MIAILAGFAAGMVTGSAAFWTGWRAGRRELSRPLTTLAQLGGRRAGCHVAPPPLEDWQR